ncbi:MAG: tRNA-guanine transglycosylase, partial [Nitrososphaera sp.]
MNFEIADTDHAARLGRLRTRHGPISTPVFFPVYYAGVDFGWTTPHYWNVFPEINTIMLNASHIMMHSKKKLDHILQEGLKRLIGFDGVSFIDSGGWVYHRLGLTYSQQQLLDLQEELGADVASTLDYPINIMSANGINDISRSVENAIAASKRRRNQKMLLFASIHGSDPLVIRNVIRYLDNKGDFDGFAIGSMMRAFSSFE